MTTHMPNAHTLRLNFQDSEAVVDNFLRLKRRPSSVLQELDKLLTFVTGSPSASPASPASASASVASSWLHLWYFEGMGGIGMNGTETSARFPELSHKNCSAFDLSWVFFSLFPYVPELETS